MTPNESLKLAKNLEKKPPITVIAGLCLSFFPLLTSFLYIKSFVFSGTARSVFPIWPKPIISTANLINVGLPIVILVGYVILTVFLVFSALQKNKVARALLAFLLLSTGIYSFLLGNLLSFFPLSEVSLTYYWLKSHLPAVINFVDVMVKLIVLWLLYTRSAEKWFSPIYPPKESYHSDSKNYVL